MIDKQILINWLYNQIDMELSCVEDLEMTEGVENEYGRGRISAWEMMLDGLDHFEKQTIQQRANEKLKHGQFNESNLPNLSELMNNVKIDSNDGLVQRIKKFLAR